MNITGADHKGYGAIVNKSGELLTSAQQRTQMYIAGERGEAYFVSTNFLTISTANTEYGILYIKNTANSNLHLNRIRTSGTAVQFWRFVKNPTMGTLISNGTVLIPENMGFNSGKVLQGTCKIGGQGFTLTDGKHLTQWIGSTTSFNDLDFQSAITLETNNSAALVTKVDTINSIVSANILCFYD